MVWNVFVKNSVMAAYRLTRYHNALAIFIDPYFCLVREHILATTNEIMRTMAEAAMKWKCNFKRTIKFFSIIKVSSADVHIVNLIKWKEIGLAWSGITANWLLNECIIHVKHVSSTNSTSFYKSTIMYASHNALARHSIAFNDCGEPLI